MLGYIFDINGSILSDNEIELLRHWPNDDEIGDAIRIAHSNALSFMDYLGIRQQQKKILIPNAITPDSDCEPNENENDELEILEQIHNFEGAVSEVTRLSELDETLKEMLSNDQKNTEKNGDNSDNNSDSDDNSDDENNNNNDFIKATEIQYILENSKPTIIELPENEPEESIFKNENLDIQQVLAIRSSHNAFSHSDRIRGIRHSGINLNQNSDDLVDRNYANHLITQLSGNDNSNLIIRNRNKRWLGRKRTENIDLNRNNLKGIVKILFLFYFLLFRINFFFNLDIGCANVSQNNPLEIGGFLIIFSDQKLCIGKILAMYEILAKNTVTFHVV